MTAREMAIDFIQTAGIIFLFVVSFYYFIIAGYWDTADKIVKVAALFSFIGLFFLCDLKIETRKTIRLKKEKSLDEIIVNFTEMDKNKDLLVIAFLPMLMGLAALYGGSSNVIDYLQMGLALIAAYLWHLFIFRNKDEYGQRMNATVYDKIKDQAFIFLLPLLILAIPLIFHRFDAIDFIQAIIPFIIISLWHKCLIKKRT